MSELFSSDKVNAGHFYATKRFLDDLTTLNQVGLLNDVYKDIYPPELQLEVEHFATHATFLNLGITVKDGVFLDKLFDRRETFLSFYVCIIYIPNHYSILLLLVNFLK